MDRRSNGHLALKKTSMREKSLNAHRPRNLATRRNDRTYIPKHLNVNTLVNGLLILKIDSNLKNLSKEFMAERKMVRIVQSLKNEKNFESALTPPHKRKILCFTKGATFSNS